MDKTAAYRKILDAIYILLMSSEVRQSKSSRYLYRVDDDHFVEPSEIVVV